MRTLITVAAVAVLMAGGCTAADRFPAAPILLVCPWTAGGGSDRVARQLAVLLERDLGVPVNVINATGGDGVTGHSRGALARPDGYTMTLVTVEIATLHWRQMTSISHRDFASLGLVNRDAAAVFVRSDAPWQSLKDLEQAVRERPGTLRASGTATAGIWHLALAGWLTAVGLQPSNVIWVSIAGSAPSLQELVAGGIDVVVCSLAEARALLDAGRVRTLGVMAGERVGQFPTVPTLKEQGVDFSLGTIRALAVPRDVPAERVRTLAAAVERAVHSEAYLASMASGGFTPAYEDPAQMSLTLEQTDQRLGALLQSEAFTGLADQRIGPMFFPGALFVALAGVVLALLTGRSGRSGGSSQGDRGDRGEESQGDRGDRGKESQGDRGDQGDRSSLSGLSVPSARFFEPLLWIVLYVALAEWLGFLLTAGGLLLVYLVRLGTRFRVALPLTLVLVPVAYVVFAVLLRVTLPRGILGW